eukprot:TRINITY_DN18367_c0_g1_i1.p1 TRINITY_DN18367_c0_g1~~TRINITY_DN18367_c0_g1_i1.p1  ORF type:complete len:585 (+),score=38.49 TRINITY_DN18367_c0_g1_i1:97-1851(+)
MYRQTVILCWKVGRVRPNVELTASSKKKPPAAPPSLPARVWDDSDQASNFEALAKDIIEIERGRATYGPLQKDKIKQSFDKLSMAKDLKGDIRFVLVFVKVLMLGNPIAITNKKLLLRLLSQNVRHDEKGILAGLILRFCTRHPEIEKFLLLSVWETVFKAGRKRPLTTDLVRQLMLHVHRGFQKKIQHLQPKHEQLFMEYIHQFPIRWQLSDLAVLLKLVTSRFRTKRYPKNQIEVLLRRAKACCFEKPGGSQSKKGFYSMSELTDLYSVIESLASTSFSRNISGDEIILLIVSILRYRVFTFDQSVSPDVAAARVGIYSKILWLMSRFYEFTTMQMRVFGVVSIRFLHAYMVKNNVTQRELIPQTIALIHTTVARMQLDVLDEIFYGPNAISLFYRSAVEVCQAAWAMYRLQDSRYDLPVNLGDAIVKYADDFTPKQAVLVLRMLLVGRRFPDGVVCNLMKKVECPSEFLLEGLATGTQDPAYIDPLFYYNQMVACSDQPLLCLAVSVATGVIMPEGDVLAALVDTAALPEWAIPALLFQPTPDILEHISSSVEDAWLPTVIDILLSSSPQSIPWLMMEYCS